MKTITKNINNIEYIIPEIYSIQFDKWVIEYGNNTRLLHISFRAIDLSTGVILKDRFNDFTTTTHKEK